MSPGVSPRLEEVDRARKRAERDERERAGSPSALKAAAARTDALRRRGGVARFLYENGLSIAALTLFVLSFAGQIVAGHRHYNDEQRQHGEQTVGVLAYLQTGDFLEATAENMESEFLQMGLFVLLTAYLYQRGSSESKTIEEPDAVDQDPREARDDPDAPWPVRRGGLWLAVYKRSLGAALLLMFVVAFAAHAIGGSMAYNEEQLQHGGEAVSALGYLATSRFWFESFQNWQSEFFSVGVLVIISIWLRQQGSAQSKPVAASASDTGE
jgi:type IV secretory pathway VirB2 component (pilin)